MELSEMDNELDLDSLSDSIDSDVERQIATERVSRVPLEIWSCIGRFLIKRDSINLLIALGLHKVCNAMVKGLYPGFSYNLLSPGDGPKFNRYKAARELGCEPRTSEFLSWIYRRARDPMQFIDKFKHSNFRYYPSAYSSKVLTSKTPQFFPVYFVLVNGNEILNIERSCIRSMSCTRSCPEHVNIRHGRNARLFETLSDINSYVMPRFVGQKGFAYCIHVDSSDFTGEWDGLEHVECDCGLYCPHSHETFPSGISYIITNPRTHSDDDRYLVVMHEVDYPQRICTAPDITLPVEHFTEQPLPWKPNDMKDEMKPESMIKVRMGLLSESMLYT